MRLNLLLVGGVFFLSIGSLGAIVSITRDFPSGLTTDSIVFGATLISVFPILVGIILIHLGTKQGRFSKRNH